jgi:maleylacetate reductase
VIVRWGLGELPAVLAEVEIAKPLVVTTPRFAEQAEQIGNADVFLGVERHGPERTVAAAAAAAANSDGLVPIGGGSAIDTAKAVSAQLGFPVVSVPTTYSGAEWTPTFGVRDEERGVKGGGSGAHLAGIVYEPGLTLGLPRAESGGTAMNSLAHCAEALYVDGHNPDGDREALAGAALIDEWLPAVLERPSDVEARTKLLEGAMHGGAALGSAGLGLAHAMAQALGGRYGLPHGAMNALCLPPALRFNLPVAEDALDRLAEAMGVEDPVARAEELARLSGFERLRDLGVPENELGEVAEATASRRGALANPRPATPAEIAELFRSIW